MVVVIVIQISWASCVFCFQNLKVPLGWWFKQITEDYWLWNETRLHCPPFLYCFFISIECSSFCQILPLKTTLNQHTAKANVYPHNTVHAAYEYAMQTATCDRNSITISTCGWPCQKGGGLSKTQSIVSTNYAVYCTLQKVLDLIKCYILSSKLYRCWFPLTTTVTSPGDLVTWVCALEFMKQKG